MSTFEANIAIHVNAYSWQSGTDERDSETTPLSNTFERRSARAAPSQGRPAIICGSEAGAEQLFRMLLWPLRLAWGATLSALKIPRAAMCSFLAVTAQPRAAIVGVVVLASRKLENQTICKRIQKKMQRKPPRKKRI